MAIPPKEKLPHITITNSATTEKYTRPNTGGGKDFYLPSVERQKHAERLISELSKAKREEQKIVELQKAAGLDAGYGMYLQFESEENFELAFESLESRPSGIELLSVKIIEHITYATVFIPEGKLTHFFKKVTKYAEENTPKDKPRNQKLIESISAIKIAALDALWMDKKELFPIDDKPIYWEVWLRTSPEYDFEKYLRQYARKVELIVNDEAIHFPDRTVLLVHGTREQMSKSVPLLNSIAEVRRAKETADFFTEMRAVKQHEWIKALGELNSPSYDAPAVCILDTGLNNKHPLLDHASDSNDMHSYEPDWGVDDKYGHGTQMAGLALHGDITDLLSSTEAVNSSHHLESVKILPKPGHNPTYLYGAITGESIARVEISQPERDRVFCMAIATSDNRDRGKPSSWSAKIDSISSGADDDQARLFILSAGNTNHSSRNEYPNSNMKDTIHDPGQSWNAITVGAFTEKVNIDTQQYPDWEPISPYGDISPSSCTSSEWGKSAWPIKPDIVMEGGNMAISPIDKSADYIDDALQLLTTGHNFLIGKPLVSFGDTSAATALASRLATMLFAEDKKYWPETIRALLVHSANWSPAMKERFNPLKNRIDYRNLLRYCGFGVPDFNDLFWSARNSLTLIAQDSLQPFDKEGDDYKTRDINLHKIPWPKEKLEELGETDVEMRVTLSYFIEPNPGERGWSRRYRYASHGLRFEVKTPEESLEQFKRRINEAARSKEHGKTSESDASKWQLGPDLRGLGSIHSDRWFGNAAELAARGHVAVYPIVGWWKERHQLERWSKRARYSLIITIKTPSIEMDIYTPVENEISTTVEV